MGKKGCIPRYSISDYSIYDLGEVTLPFSAWVFSPGITTISQNYCKNWTAHLNQADDYYYYYIINLFFGLLNTSVRSEHRYYGCFFFCECHVSVQRQSQENNSCPHRLLWVISAVLWKSHWNNYKMDCIIRSSDRQVFTDSLMSSPSGSLFLLCQNLWSVERQESFQPNITTMTENIKHERWLWSDTSKGGGRSPKSQLAKINMGPMSAGNTIWKLHTQKSK